MLSDVPHDSETEFGADPYEIEDDLEEEPDFVPIDMSAKGGNLFWFLKIVFCYQNYSDLLWEKIVFVIKKNFWNSRLEAENLPKFLDH